MRNSLHSLLLALLFPAAVLAEVDVLSADGGVFLAWSEGTRSHLLILGTDIQRTFESSVLSIGEAGPGFEYLAVAWQNGWDSLAVLDPLTLETVMARTVILADILPGVPGQGNPSMRLARHEVGDSGIWVHSVVDGYDPIACYAVSSRFVPDPVLGLVMDASLFFGGTCGSEELVGICSETRPLQCAAQDPPTQFFRLVHSTTPYIPYTHQIFSSVHQEGPELGSLDWAMLCSYVEPPSPRIEAAGSCHDAILLLWSLAPTDAILCSTFDGLTPVPQSTGEIDLPLETGMASAMSCNRLDPGLLLAMQVEDGLWVRHYQGEWNPFSHQVAGGIGPIEPGNLSVCSDDEGYWIAWLAEERAEPEVLFLPRDSVTGIPSIVPPGEVSLSVSPASNPLLGIPVLDIAGDGPADLSVYDVSGRQVFAAPGSEGPTPLELPGAGVYFAEVTRGSSRASVRFTFLD